MINKAFEKLYKDLIRQTSWKPTKQIIIFELEGGSRPFFSYFDSRQNCAIYFKKD
jgi:hypothetical protein